MKTKLTTLRQGGALLLLLTTLNPHLSSLFAQGTAFTYQGRLNDGANPANGTYDLRFIVFDNSAGGNQQGPLLTNSATSVSNGLFTVTLDFGNQFPGAGRWLEFAVRTNGNGSFFTLIPRQPLTPAPYAITAGAVVSGGITGTYGNAVTFNNANNNFSGAFSGNGANVTNVNAATLGGLSSSNFWKSFGNAGTTPGTQFLGTTDNLPMEFKVNGTRALRLEPNPNAPNVIGGASVNVVANGVMGATIGGGGEATDHYTNRVTADFGTVSGGAQNVAGPLSVVGGGGYNTASGTETTISGGEGNTASGDQATVGGGNANTASGQAATVVGGSVNTASGDYSTVGGGTLNTASGDYSTAMGYRAKANHYATYVWADDSQTADFSSTADEQFLIRAKGGVGIGLNNPASQLHVASASGQPQLQITQTTTSDYTRLRMNVAGSPSWEMDVSPGATPALSWWTATLKMNLDYNGNLTTSGTVNGSSARNVKEHFSPVSARDVLEKVSSWPITEWNYITDGETLRHIGPMAQDFYAAFNVGTDDKHISMVDADGVALAAIRGLNQKLAEQEASLKKKDSELEELRRVVAELQKAVRTITNETQD